MNKLDKYLIIIGVFLLLFTIAMTVIFCYKYAIPDTLVASVFAICSVEGGVCGWIKNAKERKEERQWMIEDEERRKNEQQNL